MPQDEDHADGCAINFSVAQATPAEVEQMLVPEGDEVDAEEEG